MKLIFHRLITAWLCESDAASLFVNDCSACHIHFHGRFFRKLRGSWSLARLVSPPSCSAWDVSMMTSTCFVCACLLSAVIVIDANGLKKFIQFEFITTLVDKRWRGKKTKFLLFSETTQRIHFWSTIWTPFLMTQSSTAKKRLRCTATASHKQFISHLFEKLLTPILTTATTTSCLSITTRFLLTTFW